VAQAANRVEAAAADPSAAGDLALLFAYMKVLDPGSVVRESEFANAQSAASIPSRIRGHWLRVINGERLAPETRADFVKQSKALATRQAELLRDTNVRYRTLANRFGIDPNLVVHDPFDRQGRLFREMMNK
jgi:hypothetical protein